MPAFVTNPTYMAIPNPAQPVQGKPQQPPAQAQAPQQPPDPFRVRPGPGILILPYQPDEQPSRQSRLRFNRETIQRLFSAVHEDAHDDARWHALADAFEEAGKPSAAEFARAMTTFQQRGMGGNAPFKFRSNFFSQGLGTPPHGIDRSGSICGVSIVLRGTYAALGMNGRRAGLFWDMPREFAQRLEAEMDPDHTEPQRMGRLRFNRDTIQRVWRHVVEDPHDDARWHALADAFEEAGKPAHAELMRGFSDAERVIYNKDGSLAYHPTIPWRRLYSPVPALDKYRDTRILQGHVFGIPIELLRNQSGNHGLMFGSHSPTDRDCVGEGYISEDLGQRLTEELDIPPAPEKFAAAKAPAGGFITRGIYGKGGEFLPAEASPVPVAAPEPAKKRRSLRDRMRKIARTRLDKSGSPIRLEPEKMAKRKRFAPEPVDPNGPVDLPGLEHVKDPQRLAMIREIAKSPNDPAARYAMADWLEERGETNAAEKVRWYEHAKAEALHHTKLDSRESPTDWSALHSAASLLQSSQGHDAVVLAGNLAHHISRELYPINWDAIRPHHKDPDALRRQIDGAHLAVELIATGIMPRDSAWAARDSAGAAHGSAGAAYNSAGAAYNSAWSARGSAGSAYNSAWSARGSAGAAYGSAWAAHGRITRIAHAAMAHPHWKSFPKAKG